MYFSDRDSVKPSVQKELYIIHNPGEFHGPARVKSYLAIIIDHYNRKESSFGEINKGCEKKLKTPLFLFFLF